MDESAFEDQILKFSTQSSVALLEIATVDTFPRHNQARGTEKLGSFILSQKGSISYQNVLPHLRSWIAGLLHAGELESSKLPPRRKVSTDT